MAAKKRKKPKTILYVLIVFLAFVGIISFYKITSSPKNIVYAKVKLSQGFWWAATSNPDIWFLNGLKKGEEEQSLLGQTDAKLIDIEHYPYFSENTKYEDKYNIYLTIALNSNSQKGSPATFKRQPISIGAPISINFPSTQVSGTIIDLSSEPYDNSYVEKTVYLIKRYAYPWEYDAIKIGDKYFDGENSVFEVVDKSQQLTTSLSPDPYGNLTGSTTENARYITVKAKVKAREKNGLLIWGEEKILTPGSLMPAITQNFVFEDFIISKVE